MTGGIIAYIVLGCIFLIGVITYLEATGKEERLKKINMRGGTFAVLVIIICIVWVVPFAIVMSYLIVRTIKDVIMDVRDLIKEK